MLYFPHPLTADQDGLLAIGGDLSLQRMLLAYRYGIFPWYNQDPIMWWWTHPRCIINVDEVKIAKSMRTYFNNDKYQISYNRRFEEVITACASIQRNDQMGTWINKDIIDSYVQLHELGYAHSVEVWDQSELIGGLYGIGMGKIFFGESMYSKARDASKFGFISLCQKLKTLEVHTIDCQQETQHLKSLGAKTISKDAFWEMILHNQPVADQKLKLN